jgi:hypothetical protein
MKPVPRRMHSVCSLVDAFNLDTLRKHHANERLKIFERPIAKAIAYNSTTVPSGSCSGSGIGDTPLSRVTMMPAEAMPCNTR